MTTPPSCEDETKLCQSRGTYQGLHPMMPPGIGNPASRIANIVPKVSPNCEGEDKTIAKQDGEYSHLLYEITLLGVFFQRSLF